VTAERKIWIAGTLAMVAALAIIPAWPTVLCALPIGCPVRAVWGIPCPGCGMTRAVALLLSGDFAGSLGMHALAIPILLFLGVFALRKAGFLPAGLGSRLPSGTYFAALIALLTYHGARLGSMLVDGTLADSFQAGVVCRAASWILTWL